MFYGHWHRSIDPRVLWNSDGTWTLLMELDTSGGAIDTPTIGHFSTPWSRPQQEASFPVVFLDQESRLVTGYQVYRFADRRRGHRDAARRRRRSARLTRRPESRRCQRGRCAGSTPLRVMRK